MSKLKIYFAGSIRGGREDQLVYAALIGELSKLGTVLTEHIGDKTLSPGGEQKPESDIYNRDRKWIDEADIIVAEVTVPSHGVGYEIGYAESLGKPIFCINRKMDGRKLSAMLQGNGNVICLQYVDPKELANLLTPYLNNNLSLI